MQKTNLNTADDIELLAGVSKGSRLAFDILYEKYWKTVFNAAYKRANDREIAEDIAQDVFVQLWTRNTDIVITNLSAYLSIAARNGVFKRMGKEDRYTELTDELQDIQNSLDSTDANILHKEFLNAFAELIESLPSQQQAIFKFRFNEGLSSQQIAEKLQISPKTVRNHIGRALITLKKELILLQILAILCRK
ncbi:MAG TPA: sigma-70 family RNA polymerase sigma factor [Mucilaginibacter sp.]|nr:sigma-70 family RNA polymerase sigma factor [Mucilaginibacter sp.]